MNKEKEYTCQELDARKPLEWLSLDIVGHMTSLVHFELQTFPVQVA